MQTSQEMTVLVGDDDSSVCASIAELVVGRGLMVATATTGSGALGILVSRHIDFSILDVHLPDMTGFDVIERYVLGPWIAASGREPARRTEPKRMPAIFMSGDATDDVRRRCVEHGWPLIDKPVEADVMRSAIDQVLLQCRRS